MSADGLRLGGATRLYAIVGDPIAQVGSPAVFSTRFQALGADAILVPAHVPPDRFDEVFRALMALRNLDGLLVTVPFKARALPFADRVGRAGRMVGAINALKREADGSWSGEMFDGTGMVRAFQRKGERLEGRRVGLFGAGGAGSAIAFALADAGVASIDVVDPEAGRAGALRAKLAPAFPACRIAAATAVPANADLVVNASTVGMRVDDGLPGPLPDFAPGTLVGDVIVTQTPTAILKRAIAAGCAHVGGRDMLAGQADAIVEFFAPAARRPQ